MPHYAAAGRNGKTDDPLDRAPLAFSADEDKLRRQSAQGFDSPCLGEWHGDSVPNAGDVSSLGHTRP